MKQAAAFLIVVALFFTLAVFQTSFLSHIAVGIFVPNLVFILFFAVIFFQNGMHWFWGVAYAVAAGLCIDLFSLAGNFPYIGPGIIACLASWTAILGLGYFLREHQDSYLIMYFCIVFLASFAAYLAVLFGISYL